MNTVRWQTPSQLVLDTWHNRDDATRDGAYAVAIAAVQQHLGLFVRRRAETQTGADYYITPRPADTGDDDTADVDLEEPWLRLEASGIDRCPTIAELRTRVLRKEAQTRRGASVLPAIVGVVAFSMPRIAITHVQ
ncbi:MAG: hypothetical protein ACYDCQ_18080 [Dehalococcoidia bacterium]